MPNTALRGPIGISTESPNETARARPTHQIMYFRTPSTAFGLPARATGVRICIFENPMQRFAASLKAPTKAPAPPPACVPHTQFGTFTHPAQSFVAP
eukprot:4483423-Pyramimonas_sp.AAC.1